MSFSEWLSELLPIGAQYELIEKPCTNSYDVQLLLILENWHRDLDALWRLERWDVNVNPHWPYAFTSLNHLLTRCHDRIYKREGAGHPQTDVTLSRLIVVVLLSLNFGLWLEDIGLQDKWNFEQFSRRFRNRSSSFNVDFVAMDLEFSTAAGNEVTHSWNQLPIKMLFPDADPKQFSGPLLQQQQEPLNFLGAWQSEGIDELLVRVYGYLRDERIESNSRGSEQSERSWLPARDTRQEADSIQENLPKPLSEAGYKLS
ncbi:hypothetical protein F5Y12DRAFT_715257 [Xylaria sp. FL1777]|nr:hypothetical protein F5Y12DRAFT_715257 [Xylaria sp. FL1777]